MNIPAWLKALILINAAFLFWSVFCFYQIYFKTTVVTVDRLQVDAAAITLSYRHAGGHYHHWLRTSSNHRLTLISDSFGFHGDLSTSDLAELAKPKPEHDLGTYLEADEIANFPLDLERRDNRVIVSNGFGKQLVFEINPAL